MLPARSAQIKVLTVLLLFAIMPLEHRAQLNTQTISFDFSQPSSSNIDLHSYNLDKNAINLLQRAQDLGWSGEVIHDPSGKFYLIKNCGLGVYYLKDTMLLNLYHMENNGFNCHSKKFFFSDELYSLGGYGFWRTHSMLIKFVPFNNEWEIVPTENLPENAFFNVLFRKENKIFSLFQIKINQGSTEASQYDNTGYMLNLETMRWYNVSILPFGKNEIEPAVAEISHFVVESENYALFKLKTKNYVNYIYVIDKHNLTIHKADFNWPNNPLSLLFISGDSLNFIDRDSQISKTFALEESNLSKPIAKIQLTTEKPRLLKFLLALVLLLLLGVVTWVFYRNKKVKDPSGKDHFMRIEDQVGKTFDSNEIDQILELSDIENIDSRRVKRSRLIKKINAESSAITIQRFPDPSDRRYSLYKVVAKNEK